MVRPHVEVADIFRRYGPAWRQQQSGHLSLGQLQVMSAIEHCRTDHLGGHVLFCDHCNRLQIAYNSCRNRHCPKCQARSRHYRHSPRLDVLERATSLTPSQNRTFLNKFECPKCAGTSPK